MVENLSWSQPFKNSTAGPIEIAGELIQPGDNKILRISAGKLPSDNRINVFAHVYHSKIPGPCLLILGGVHGNEINGIEIVRRAIENKIFENISTGTVILVPLLNVYGFIYFSRDVPDGKDVNRSFPGHANGSLASRVARILTKHILPHVDIAYDLHTGGDARYNYPQVRYYKGDVLAKKLATMTHVPFIISHPLIPHSFRKIAHDMGIPAIVYEAGESVRFDKLSIDIGYKSVLHLSDYLGLLPLEKPLLPKDYIAIQTSKWIRAKSSGIFTWHIKSGEKVDTGTVLGTISDPYGTKSEAVKSPQAGYIIGHNNASVVSLGDALFHLTTL